MHIEMRMVAKRFGRTDALKDVDLEVEGPAILAILGENGAG
ncbi:MAG: sugar ABC transporter ATP-binding protein, partial [Akkermansiaceae bacterium]|nr:sugar ABC transporter ATP-binding protein [Akkermansiaceae bacterium]